MKTIRNLIGNEVKVFAETFENEAYEQVRKLADFEPYQKSKIRIMPDSHAGKGCTVGTTMTIAGKVTPNLVGVDIGCGMLVVELQERNVNLEKLDAIIHDFIPSGFNVHDEPLKNFAWFTDLRCLSHVDRERALRSIGSLGGGNHFIEVDKGEDGRLYLVIHSGSRNLGVGVCNYYQNLAYDRLTNMVDRKKELIRRLKSQGREKDINSELQKLQRPKISKELAYLEGKDFEDYINDMEIVQRFASLNRMTIAELILEYMGLHVADVFETVHNYIDIKNMILRKGAVSAQKDERFIVPINMRDGSLICIGKGNEDWNCSAPHGAGRLMSRSKAKETVSMK